MRKSHRLYVALLGFCSLSLPALRAESFENVEKSASEWLKLRTEASRAETAWKEERVLLEATIAATNERAAALEEKRDAAKAKTAKDREDLETLHNKCTKESEELKAFDARVKSLATQILALRPNLPPRLADALELSFTSLGDPAIPSGERLQIAMSALNRCVQFNHSITVSDDALTINGTGTEKLYTVIYWGMGQAYAVDRASHTVWIGGPSAQGWHW